jgi:hypothetical protein
MANIIVLPNSGQIQFIDSGSTTTTLSYISPSDGLRFSGGSNNDLILRISSTASNNFEIGGGTALVDLWVESIANAYGTMVDGT